MKKGIIICTLIATLAVGGFSVAAVESQTSKVTASVGSQYAVSIPKLINLSVDENGTGTATYDVDVQADIGDTNSVYVTPQQEFTLLKGSGTVGVLATVTQEKQEWLGTEFYDGTYTKGTGFITAENITVGNWEGSLYFNIKKDVSGITVEEPDTSTVNTDTVELVEGQTTDGGTYLLGKTQRAVINATVGGESVSSMLTYTSSNPNITVDEDGVIDTSNASAGEEAVITGSYTPAATYSLRRTAALTTSVEYTIKVIDIEVIDIRTETYPGGTIEFDVKVIPEDLGGEATVILRNTYYDRNTDSYKFNTPQNKGYQDYRGMLKYDGFTKMFTVSTKPGLYETDGDLIKSWDELKATAFNSEDGLVTNVTDTSLDGVLAISDTGIDWNKFNVQNCVRITRAIIPDGVTTLNGTFNGCSRLKYISIPDTVCTLGDSTFKGCWSLTNVILPKSLTDLGSNTFYDCLSLSSVTIPDGVTNIGAAAFKNCESLTSIAVPNSVVGIGDSAFEYCDTLKTVSLPSTLGKISNRMFYECGDLTNFNMPANVTSIGDFAFYSCSSLPDITIPNTVGSIGESAFDSCSDLENVYLPDSVTTIGKHCFNYCTGIKTLRLSNSLKTIPDGALFYLKALEEISVPEGVTKIGVNAISCNKILHTINLPSTLKSIDVEGVGRNPNVTQLTVPKGVTTIGTDAFIGTANILYTGSATNTNSNNWGASFRNMWYEDGFIFTDSTKKTLVKCMDSTNKFITVPDSVVTIQEEAFSSSATGRTYLQVSVPDTVKTIGYKAFYGVLSVNYTGSATGTPWGATKVNGATADGFVYSDSAQTILIGYIGDATSVVVPDKVTTIKTGAFTKYGNVTYVEVPDSVTTIESKVFNSSAVVSYTGSATGAPWGASTVSTCSDDNFVYTDSSKTEVVRYIGSSPVVTFPDTVTIVGSRSFTKNTNITRVSIPSTVLSIGDYTFSGCTNLAEVSLPSTITSIGKSVFNGCTSLTEINLPSTITSIGTFAFTGCTSLTEVTLPDSVTSIDYSAFSECCALEIVELSENLESIGEYAFEECTALKAIRIPSKVKTIGRNAFEDCKSLKDIEIAYGVESIGEYAFFCSAIVQIEIPDSVTSIGKNAFSSCKALTTVELPANLISIEDYTFNWCTSLTTIKFNNTLQSIGQNAFSSCKGLAPATLQLPSSLVSIGKSAFLNSYAEEIIVPDSVTSIGTKAFLTVGHVVYNGNAEGTPWGATSIN